MNAQEIINQVTRVERSKQLTNRGFDEFANGNFEEALSCANRALELNSKNPLTLQLRALCKCIILANRDSITPTDEADLREVVLDLANATNLIHEIQSISRNLTSIVMRDNIV